MILRRGDSSDLRVFYDAHRGRLGMDFEKFKSLVSDWDVWCLDDNGPVAIILTKCGHGHIATTGRPVGILRMKQAMSDLDVRYTTVGAAFRKGHSLAKRLGFCKIAEDGLRTTYERRW